jgi:hypothetical protein
MSYVYPSVTDEAYDAAFERLIPYVEGYPYPMIDARRLRIKARQASHKDLLEIAAEDAVLADLREAGMI